MKKFFLYLLMFLFIAGLATLTYGFWNAKNIRSWAVAAQNASIKHDTSAKEREIVDSLNAIGSKKSEEFKSSLDDFKSSLDAISKEMELAKVDMEQMSTPRAARPLKSEIVDYYDQGGQQVRGLASTVEFFNLVFDATIVFDKIVPDTTIEEIRGTIADAKAKSDEIDPKILPAEMQETGSDLKTAVYNYLDTFDQYAAEKIEDHVQLDSSYAEFSQKVKDFWEARKKLSIYASAKDMDLASQKIDEDLLVLRKVKFSIK